MGRAVAHIRVERAQKEKSGAERGKGQKLSLQREKDAKQERNHEKDAANRNEYQNIKTYRNKRIRKQNSCEIGKKNFENGIIFDFHRNESFSRRYYEIIKENNSGKRKMGDEKRERWIKNKKK